MRIGRWQLEDKSIPEQFFGLAKAYLESAAALFNKMGKVRPGSYYQALVADFLAEHAVELFFKGAILQATNELSIGHDLEQLYGRYRILYPSKRFQFLGRIDEFVGKHRNRPNSEYPRYPIDRAGRKWEVSEYFNPDVWFEQLSAFLNDFDRLIPLIRGAALEGSRGERRTPR